jgi:hypothetical protein
MAEALAKPESSSTTVAFTLFAIGFVKHVRDFCFYIQSLTATLVVMMVSVMNFVLQLFEVSKDVVLLRCSYLAFLNRFRERSFNQSQLPRFA